MANDQSNEYFISGIELLLSTSGLVLLRCWLGDRKGIRPVKKLDVGLLVVMI